MPAEPKPSLTDLALRAKRAFVFGNGGGGDVIQAIPIANHLRKLGVQEIFLGGVNCAWIDDDGAAQGTGTDADPATFVLGPTIYDLDELTYATPVSPHMVEVTPDTRLRGGFTGEAAAATLLGHRTFVISLADGVQAAAREVQAFVDTEAIDLVVSTDVGSDSFYSGEESYPAHTALVDFMSLGILTHLSCPTVFSLGGWGLDGELVLEDLQRNVATTMRHGGFIGGLGLSQEDTILIEQACALYHDPVEEHVPRAARGEFGWTTVRTLGPWGHPMCVTPLAAMLLFFDPKVMAAHVCTAVPAIAATASLADAEEAFERHFGLPPETRLIRVARLRAPGAAGRNAGTRAN
jgi:hypothetical protein